MYRLAFLLIVGLLLGGCSRTDTHADLQAYIDEVKRKPAGRVEPIPPYPSFEGFSYSAASKRSPFDKPIDIQRRVFAKSGSNVRPDFNRTKEFLEGFDIASLSMVGTLKKGGTLWALVRHTSGEIKPVAPGHYMGKNHGKIINIDNTKIELIEIVSDGLDGWVERPRLIALAEKD